MPCPLESLTHGKSVLVAPWLFLIALALAGCDSPAPIGPPGAGPPDVGPPPCAPGELTLADGTCQKAGLPPPPPCPPGELLLEDGITCQKAGVPPSACGVGFLPDGKEGCEPILPADPCPEGQMAVPGDTACHEVAPCGSGTWGDIPVEANTQFVNKSYAGKDSDGTQAKPWTTIQQGVNKAAKGAIVAVAAGSYAEGVMIQGKPVRLWGRCPAMVEVVGTGVALAAILVVQKAAGEAEIHSLAVTGAKLGIGVSGASDVVVEGVWVHDVGHHGFVAQNDLGLTSVVLRGSLIEQNEDVGVFVSGAAATIEATVVRSSLPDAQGEGGTGIAIQDEPQTKARANVTVRGCLVEQNYKGGVFVGGSDARIEATVIRSTLPGVQQGDGRGVMIQDDPQIGARADVTVRGCLIEQNHGMGVTVVGSDAIVEATVVRSNLPDSQGKGGRGINIEYDPAAMGRANVTVRACLVEQNHELGVAVLSSDATIEATVVRSTLPGVPGTLKELGFGIVVQNHPATNERANVTVRACVVEQNHSLGVAVKGSDATIESTVVRATLPNAQGEAGHGIQVQDNLETKARANVTVRACLIEQNRHAGVVVVGSDAIIEATEVRSTLNNGQESGIYDGVGISITDSVDTNARANVTVRACLFEQNRSVGVFVEGSDATIEATVVRSTLPNSKGESGNGIAIQVPSDTNARADVTVRACVVEQNHESGVFIEGSDVTIEATVVRSTLPDSKGEFGRGIGIQSAKGTNDPANVTVQGCLVEQNQDAGIYVFRSDVLIDASVVRDTYAQTSDGKFGDGISVFKGAVTLENIEVTHNARAGISSFGGQVVITGGVITCNGFDLEGEPKDGIPFTFDGSTGWQCSAKAPAECTELGNCHVETTGIEAPSELPPADPWPPPSNP